MLRASSRYDLARAAGAFLFALSGCSSDDPPGPPQGTAGAGGSAGSTTLLPTAGASGSNVAGSGAVAGTSTAGGASGAGAGTGGTSVTGGVGGALGGAAGTSQGGSAPVAGQPGAGAAGIAGANSAGAGGVAGGAGGMSGSAGMGMAGRVNPPGECKSTYTGQGWNTYNNNGSITFYTFNMGTGNNVHCSYGIQQRNPDVVRHTYTGEGRYFAAINTSDYRAGAACGACVEISRNDGRKVIATVVDECPVGTNPKCKAGHIDLSQAAFRQLAQDSEGHVGTGNGGCCGQISWKYVPCPVPATENVSVRLKEPDNQYYTTVIVQSHRYPITSVQINGRDAMRQPDNFWIVGDGNQAPGPWQVRAVDINNWIYEATLSLNQSGDVSTGTRAMCE